MSTKHTYTVNRAMHGNGKDYARGDTRELTATDAAPLVASGALTKKGDKTVEPEPAVQHTFGAAPSDVNNGGYTSAAGEGIQLPKLGYKSDASQNKADAKTGNKAAG